MRKSIRAAAMIATLVAASVAMAQGPGDDRDGGAPMGPGMMNGEMMNGGQMEGRGGMMGMMQMMQQMSGMMEACNTMMQAMAERSGMPEEAPTDAPGPQGGNG